MIDCIIYAYKITKYYCFGAIVLANELWSVLVACCTTFYYPILLSFNYKLWL
jgi:hypothetical protein